MYMMPCKHFSLNVFLLVLYHCFQLLFVQVTWCARINGLATCTSYVMQCANAGEINYPFWGTASCAASPDYVLSNCTSSSADAYWDSFSVVAHGVVGSPAVISVANPDVPPTYQYDSSGGYYGIADTSILLSWNKSLIELGYCAPLFSATNLSLYNIPPSINLTRFSDSSALEFSAINTYLLFNCTHNASDVVAHLGSQNFEAESTLGCMPYKGFCTSRAKTPCIQWFVPASTKELMLKDVLDTLACSHFMFGIFERSTQWFTASFEFRWRDIQCEKCQNASGDCIYVDGFPTKFNYCSCRYNMQAFDFNTQTCNYLASEFYHHDYYCDGGLLQCNTGAKIGLVVAAIVVVLGTLAIFGVKCYKGNLGGVFRERIRIGFLSFIKATVPIAILVLKTTLRKLQSVSYGPTISLNAIDFDELTERPVEYSYSSIASATKSFSNLLGEGGFGAVYKGAITSASSHGGLTEIAVKVLEVRSKHSKQQFLNEVITIGRIHHVNVVRLLGFCMQEDHEMLVYEYVVNGSLDRWLFDKKGKAQEQVLDWGQRYAIALGIARGLSHLHEECRHRTVHCDIKPQNILLDEDMHPKIADFGLARLMGRDESKVVTLAKGTPGYMAPEFWMGGESHLTTKFDVYSYGMVLLELISGQRNFRRDATASGSTFPALAFKAAMERDLESILDARLGITSDGDEAQKQTQWQQIKTAAFVALWCIQDHPARRLCMSEVVKYLEGGAAVSECPPQPTISISTLPSPQEFSNSHRTMISSHVK